MVIGKRGRDIAPEQAASHIFGYTCVNDVTAFELLKSDPSFAQWTRAKSFDGFGPFGPVIATAVNPAQLAVRTLVNGRERPHHLSRDLIFPPRELVTPVSRALTLLPAALIAPVISRGP